MRGCFDLGLKICVSQQCWADFRSIWQVCMDQECSSSDEVYADLYLAGTPHQRLGQYGNPSALLDLGCEWPPWHRILEAAWEANIREPHHLLQPSCFFDWAASWCSGEEADWHHKASWHAVRLSLSSAKTNSWHLQNWEQRLQQSLAWQDESIIDYPSLHQINSILAKIMAMASRPPAWGWIDLSVAKSYRQGPTVERSGMGANFPRVLIVLTVRWFAFWRGIIRGRTAHRRSLFGAHDDKPIWKLSDHHPSFNELF